LSRPQTKEQRRELLKAVQLGESSLLREGAVPYSANLMAKATWKALERAAKGDKPKRDVTE
jgi:hypothetical protein